MPLCHCDLLDGGCLREPEDLDCHTLIHYATAPYSLAQWLAQAGVPDQKPVGKPKFEHMYQAMQAAAKRLGMVLGPLFLAIDEIGASRLCGLVVRTPRNVGR